MKIAGHHGRLSLVMTSFQPQVRCTHPTSSAANDCYGILATMPTSKDLQAWGKRGTRYVVNELPYHLFNYDRTCTATIRQNRGPSSITSWYRIWEDLVAVEGMCSRHGLDGQAFALGLGRNIVVDMKRDVDAGIAIS
ncbi:MAG: hypothetical protein Q9226_002145 [Calogaya cf. arnoldii]